MFNTADYVRSVHVTCHHPIVKTDYKTLVCIVLLCQPSLLLHVLLESPHFFFFSFIFVAQMLVLQTLSL